MEAILKNIEQHLEYGRRCYLLTYQLNDSIMKIEYCLEHYFKMEHLVEKSIELIDKAKEVAKIKRFVEIQLYLPTDKYTHNKFFTKQDYDKAVSFYKKNGFKFYPKSSVKMYYKLTNKNK